MPQYAFLDIRLYFIGLPLRTYLIIEDSEYVLICSTDRFSSLLFFQRFLSICSDKLGSLSLALVTLLSLPLSTSVPLTSWKVTYGRPLSDAWWSAIRLDQSSSSESLCVSFTFFSWVFSSALPWEVQSIPDLTVA